MQKCILVLFMLSDQKKLFHFLRAMRSFYENILRNMFIDSFDIFRHLPLLWILGKLMLRRLDKFF